jgi:hypothetical protein
MFDMQVIASRFLAEVEDQHAHRGIMRVIFDHLRPGGPHNA